MHHLGSGLTSIFFRFHTCCPPLSDFYINKLVSGCVMLIAMSVCLFLLTAEEADRLMGALAIFAGLVAFLFVASVYTPVLPYSTALDQFLMLCFVTVIAQAGVHAAMFYAREREKLREEKELIEKETAAAEALVETEEDDDEEEEEIDDGDPHHGWRSQPPLHHSPESPPPVQSIAMTEMAPSKRKAGSRRASRQGNTNTTTAGAGWQQHEQLQQPNVRQQQPKNGSPSTTSAANSGGRPSQQHIIAVRGDGGGGADGDAPQIVMPGHTQTQMTNDDQLEHGTRTGMETDKTQPSHGESLSQQQLHQGRSFRSNTVAPSPTSADGGAYPASPSGVDRPLVVAAGPPVSPRRVRHHILAPLAGAGGGGGGGGGAGVPALRPSPEPSPAAFSAASVAAVAGSGAAAVSGPGAQRKYQEPPSSRQMNKRDRMRARRREAMALQASQTAVVQVRVTNSMNPVRIWWASLGLTTISTPQAEHSR